MTAIKKVLGAVIEKMNFNAIMEIVNNVKLGNTGYAYLRKLGPNESIEKVEGVKTVGDRRQKLSVCNISHYEI